MMHRFSRVSSIALRSKAAVSRVGRISRLASVTNVFSMSSRSTFQSERYFSSVQANNSCYVDRVKKVEVKDEENFGLSESQKANLDILLDKSRVASDEFKKLDQAAVDKIFFAVALEANQNRLFLAKEAVKDTELGIVEDKTIKNQFASEYIFHAFKDTKTVGIIEEDISNGFSRFAEPYGVVAAIVPVTNPTSTIIFKCLLALKTRNAIVVSPHPRAAECSTTTVELLYKAAVAAGAPENCIQIISDRSREATTALIHDRRINFLLATGGGSMVRACYSSGTPCIGVGAGNTPVIIDETADVNNAVSSILLSKSFDNGVICASEQSVIVVDEIYDQAKEEFKKRGAYFLTKDETERVRKLVIKPNGNMNADIVGQSADKIASMCNITLPKHARILIAEIETVGPEEPLSREKLCPVLGMYRRNDFDSALDTAVAVLKFGGMGHTSCLFTDEINKKRIEKFQFSAPTGRVLLNMPTTFGAIGDVYNFRMSPSLTLGCGTWGGNSVAENIGVNHLLNIKQVAYKRENMLWVKIPKNIYFKRHILGEALKDLKNMNIHKVMIVSDDVMLDVGLVDKLTTALNKLNISHDLFHGVLPNPTSACVQSGVDLCHHYKPDCIIALGGGSVIDAAKTIKLMYEHPNVKLEECYTRFMDIRKRIVEFPASGTKIKQMVAIPTTSGTAAEVTPFVVITDSESHRKFPIADYVLTPDMAIVDSEFAMSMPPKLTANTGLDAITHAIEALTSIVANDFSRGNSYQALKLLFEHLPEAYKNGQNEVAREQVHHGSTIAGLAFANAFLGICHSLAHALGSVHNVPHGLANALMLTHVIKFNAVEDPHHIGVFPQYKEYRATEDYASIADAIGLTESSVGLTSYQKTVLLVEHIEALKKELHVPENISAALPGVSEEEFRRTVHDMAEVAFDDQCTPANPRYPMISELEEIYMDAFKGPPEMRKE